MNCSWQLTLGSAPSLSTVGTTFDDFSDIGGPRQRILLRVIPGVDAPTMAAISTGHHGSKFGMPLEDAARAIDQIQNDRRFELLGLHVHVGSQICSVNVFGEAVAASPDSVSSRCTTSGVGSGFVIGVVTPQPRSTTTSTRFARRRPVTSRARPACGSNRADHSWHVQGLTLYRVVTVKRGDTAFVAVDGGIADNFEASTYIGTRFEAVLVDRPSGGQPVELVGRQCESGDLFASDLPLEDPQPGDVVAMPMTGAYTYTLWNNYNGALRPPVVFVADGESRLVVRRETYEELTIRDV